MANDNNKAIKELLEVIKNKVGRIEAVQGIQSLEIKSIKEQVSVLNEKMDGLQEDVGILKSDMVIVKSDLKKLDKKADGILEYAHNVDAVVDSHEKRLTKIERVPIIAHALKK